MNTEKVSNENETSNAVSTSASFKEIKDKLINHLQQKYPNIISKQPYSKEEEIINFLIFET